MKIRSLLLCTIAAGLQSILVAQENPHGKLAIPCKDCHTTSSFKEVQFAHEQTGYALSLPHQKATCTDCHNIQNFRDAQKECITCHQDVHQAKMGTKCSECHQETAPNWITFDIEEIHAKTAFPILGRHALLDCQSCHTTLPFGDIRLAVNSCETCHQQDFLDAGSPNHISAGFSTNCDECHQMNGWQPANLPDHDGLFFPIYSGEHSGTWNNCKTCHNVPDNRKIFTCVDCHEHDQPTMDPKHQGIPGYNFNSKDCLLCHPTGDKAEFREHDSQFFPIFSGKHQNEWTNCTECHNVPDNRKIFSCIDCHEHSRIKMDDKHLGEVTGYRFESIACLACHPNGNQGQGD